MWDWMGKPGEVLWNEPQGMYDAKGERKKTVFDGVLPPSVSSEDKPREPLATTPREQAAAKDKETDATVTRLLRDLAVS